MRNKAFVLYLHVCFVLFHPSAGATIGIITDTTNQWFSVDQVTAAGLLACKHIQERSSYLVPDAAKLDPSLEIKCDIADTQSDESKGIEQTLRLLGDNVDVIVGAHYSALSGPISLLSGLMHTPVISYWSTAPSLSSKQQYPWFGRTIPHDLFTSYAVTSTIASMGWHSIAVLHDAGDFGQGFAQGIQENAATFDVRVLTTQRFFDKDLGSLEQGLRNIAASGAHIFAAIIYPEPTLVPQFFDLIDELGIGGRGYVWIVPDTFTPLELLAVSQNPERDRHIISGWLQVATAPFSEGRGSQFQAVWQTTDVAAIAPEGLYARENLAELTDVDCHSVCGYMYDAVWAAAWVIQNTPRKDDGEYVDKAQMMDVLRETEFVASTGIVSFDEHLDRASAGMAVEVLNWQPTGDAAGPITVVGIALWHEDTNLTWDAGAAPYWAWDLQGWDSIPQDGFTCSRGEVYSLASLECEACRPGTFQAGAACAPCAVGHYAPRSGMTVCLPCGRSGFANASGLAACFPCPGNHEMPDAPTAGVSAEECVCKDGFVFGCSWHTWELVLAVALVVLVPLMAVGVHSSRVCSKGALDPENLLVQTRVAELRKALGLRRKDGFLLPGESRTWWNRMQCARRQGQLRTKYLENFAKLTLMMSFEAEAVDSLAMQLHIIDDSDEADETGVGPLLRAEEDLDYSESPHYQAMCKLLVEVAKQLLHPDASSLVELQNSAPASGWPGQPRGSIAGAAACHGITVPRAGAAERFQFFRDRVAKLRVWDQGDNFSALKREVQVLMDELRPAMDALYLSIEEEPGGAELLAFQWPEEAPAPPAEALPQRQDHPAVKSIRVDEQSVTEMDLQRRLAETRQLSDDHSNPRPSSSSIFSVALPLDRHRASFSTLRVSTTPRFSLSKSAASPTEPSRPPRAPAEAALSPSCEIDPEPAAPSEDSLHSAPTAGLPSRGQPETSSQPTADQAGWDPWAVAVEMAEAELEVSMEPRVLAEPTGSHWQGPCRSPGPNLKARRCSSPSEARWHSLRAPRSRLQGAEDAKGWEGRSGINEEGFVHQLWLRAGLLNSGFQRQVRLAFGQQWHESLGPARIPSAVDEEQDPPFVSRGLLESSTSVKSLHGVGGGCPLKLVAGSVKTKARMLEKVNRYAEELQGEDARMEEHIPLSAKVLDPVRASVICPTPKQIVDVARWVISNGERCGLPVVRAKNKFAVQDAAEYDGYRDLMLCVLYTGEGGLKIIGEIQLHDARMYPLKVRMHRLYKVKRAASASVI